MRLTMDARELRQIVDNGSRSVDMIVNEWYTFSRPAAAYNGDAGE